MAILSREGGTYNQPEAKPHVTPALVHEAGQVAVEASGMIEMPDYLKVQGTEAPEQGLKHGGAPVTIAPEQFRGDVSRVPGHPGYKNQAEVDAARRMISGEE